MAARASAAALLTRSAAARAPRPPLYSSSPTQPPTLPRGFPPRHTASQKPSPSIPPPPTNIPRPFLFPRLTPPPPPPENTGAGFYSSPFIRGAGDWASRRVLSSLASRRSFCLVRSMCHPGLPPLPPGCAVIRRRDQQGGIVASPPAAALAQPTPARHANPQLHYHCVCSPTAHRGSFRCRWHRSGYEWGRRRP